MRRIAAAAVLAMLATVEPASAQADSVTTCTVGGSGLVLIRMPAADTVAFRDSVLRAEPLPRPGYAAEQPWFAQGSLHFRFQNLNKYGLPRFIEGHELRRVGEHQGVGVYAAASDWWRVDALYLPVRAGCVFQPYTPPHWGIPCDGFGCPFPREEAPPGAVCEIRDGELVWAQEAGDPRRGGASRVEFAESRRWYAANQSITFQGHSFGRMGLPRQLPPGSVRRIGEVDGVGVYVGPGGDTGRAWGFYVPVRPGCEFQLYEDDSLYGAVRGD
jgi:hypothetical protein